MLGLSVLRCGKTSWASYSPEAGAWSVDGALGFLDVALEQGYDVIWTTPSSHPPHHIFDKWPDLAGKSTDGQRLAGRGICPTHDAYQQLCVETAANLYQQIGHHEAVKGWQIGTVDAAVAHACVCDRCVASFRAWLEARYQSIDALNRAWQTQIGGVQYSGFHQVQLPVASGEAYSPSHSLAFRRFRADLSLQFYLSQYETLKALGAQRVTTEFATTASGAPVDRWHWRDKVDTLGLALSSDDLLETQFELALLRGPRPGNKPVWILDLDAGFGAGQDIYPSSYDFVGRQLRMCGEAGAEYVLYSHLRQDIGGAAADEGAILRFDGTPSRLAEAIRLAVEGTEGVRPTFPDFETLLLYSFDQMWAFESRPKGPSALDYRSEMERCWYSGVAEAGGSIRLGNYGDLTGIEEMVVAPYCQLREPGLVEALRNAVVSGAKLLITADFARHDLENNVIRDNALSLLQMWGAHFPTLEFLRLRDGFKLSGRLNGVDIAGSIFWARPEASPAIGGRYEEIGTLEHDYEDGCAVLRARVGEGHIFVALTALDHAGVAAMVRLASAEL
jgi:beta-galactosidase